MIIQYRAIILIIYILLSGCSLSPSVEVILIDRHTVMESEASGEWPQIEKRLHLHKGPIPLSDVNDSKRENKAFKVLNGEFSTTSSTQDK